MSKTTSRNTQKLIDFYRPGLKKLHTLRQKAIDNENYRLKKKLVKNLFV